MAVTVSRSRQNTRDRFPVWYTTSPLPVRELEMEEQKEIEVILSNLSQQTAEQTDSIRADLNIMVQLDVIFARASLAMDMNAT